ILFLPQICALRLPEVSDTDLRMRIRRRDPMTLIKPKGRCALLTILSLCLVLGVAYAQEQGKTSYMKLDITEPFGATMARMKAAKAAIQKKQTDLLNERYDLSDRPVAGVTMERGKPLQEGIRVKLPAGMTWEKLASMSPEEIRDKNLFPKGFFPLPHPNHSEGGMLFPHFEIDEI